MAARKNTRSRRATTRKGSKPATTFARTLDDDARNDIFGITLSAVAMALAVALLTENSGILGSSIASALRAAFGIGAYIVPVLLLLWGVSFFVRAFAISEGRVGTGLGIVLLALIAIFAVPVDASMRWEGSAVETHGGYVGAAVSWALTSLVGDTITYILLAAFVLVGLVITGLSISGIVDRTSTALMGAAEDGDPRQAKAPRVRAAKTMPLQEFDDGAVPDIVRSEPVSRRRSKQSGGDPEADRRTVPTPRGVAPRAMEGFVLPALTMLSRSDEGALKHRASDRELRATGSLIEETLATFDIPARVVGWIPGPTVTMFEVDLSRGIKVNRVTSLSDDLALALAAQTVRILAPIPGKSLVGIEVPNERRSTVTLGDVLAGAAPHEGGPLFLAIGKDVSGDSVISDLASMPHLLIAGSTGTGKSVCINALLMSIMMRATPSEVRLILIDPKRIELSLYNGVPHLYVPVVTEAKEAASALAWAVSEMDRRLKVLQKAGAKNVGMYNAMIHEGKAPEDSEELPYLVIVIDELADLMMVAAREVEDSICRIAQLARAAGIHLIVATQRPSTDIITGLIKTNITNRIAFAVGSSIDSRVILDQPGAERLVGQGDMLFSIPSWPKPKRIQGAYVNESEIAAVVEHLKAQAEPEYHEEILHMKVASSGGGLDTGDDDDPLLWEAADIVVSSGMGSTSLLQRRLKVGYARAGRIMDMLETKGVVGPPDGSRPREVQVDIEDLESLKAFERRDASEGME